MNAKRKPIPDEPILSANNRRALALLESTGLDFTDAEMIRALHSFDSAKPCSDLFALGLVSVANLRRCEVSREYTTSYKRKETTSNE